MLRGALGCAHPELVRLTDAERAACARRLASGIDPNVAWPAPMEPEKRAWLDASAAAHNALPHPPGIGCAVLFSGTKLYKARRPQGAIKLGPLPCYALPSRSALGDDIGLPPPSKNDPVYEGSFLRPPPEVPAFKGD